MTTSPARARSARLPRSARRSQLLQAAREVFVAQGYHASAMDDIAERAGVSKPVLYQHFPGKYELYLALVDQNSSEIVLAVQQALASTTSYREKVRAAMTAFFEFIDRESASFRLIFESDLTNDPAVRDRIRRVNVDCAKAIADGFLQAVPMSEEDAETLGIALVGMAEVTARHWLRDGRRVPIAHAVQLLTDLAWGGIRGLPLSAVRSQPGGRSDTQA